MTYETHSGGSARLRFDLGWLKAVRSWFAKNQPTDEAEHLLRLAETSPHLLKDVGFVQEADGSWSNGRKRLATRSFPDDRLSHTRGIGF